MGRIVPNERTWVGFSETRPVNPAAPTEAEIESAIDLTCLVQSINASAQGNTIPTPSLCSLFETSVPGTSQATFQGDFYRDDTVVSGKSNAADLAWTLLPRGKKGFFFISRFGGTGPSKEPQAGEKVEVWPIQITSRTAGALASNTAQTFTTNAAVNENPWEDATVAA
jgi:hypothetical protein